MGIARLANAVPLKRPVAALIVLIFGVACAFGLAVWDRRHQGQTVRGYGEHLRRRRLWRLTAQLPSPDAAPDARITEPPPDGKASDYGKCTCS